MLLNTFKKAKLRLLQKSTVSQSCSQDCLDFAERIKRKALRGRSEGSIPPYVTKAESRKQHSNSPLCNSLLIVNRSKVEIRLLTPLPYAKAPFSILVPILQKFQGNGKFYLPPLAKVHFCYSQRHSHVKEKYQALELNPLAFFLAQ